MEEGWFAGFRPNTPVLQKPAEPVKRRDSRKRATLRREPSQMSTKRRISEGRRLGGDGADTRLQALEMVWGEHERGEQNFLFCTYVLN